MQTTSLEQWKVLMLAACAAVVENESYLNELDSLIGDGDHGTSMSRGFGAVRLILTSSGFVSIGDLFTKVGYEILQDIGGAIGPLIGSFFIATARKAKDLQEVDLKTWSCMFSAGVEKVRSFGKAAPGDKTILDALIPADKAFEEAAHLGLTWQAAFHNAAMAARQGADQTAGMVAKFGRAKFLGERSVGHQDPGANSIYIILKAMEDTFEEFLKVKNP
jgi:dihydroxyacetone kinase-like protein